MRISIFGLGYVGSVSAACFCANGHSVIGVDPNSLKVDLICKGKAPVIEPQLPELLAEAHRNQRLRAVTNAEVAVQESDLSIVCVGTPSLSNGDLDASHIEEVCGEIGHALAAKSDYHLVVIRSTILPGTMRRLVIPTLEAASGKKAGVGFGVCNNPEFLREGSSVQDFLHPPKTVIGETDRRAGDMLAALYKDIPAPLIRCSIEVAEMVKYADNTWHAAKVVFANEIGTLCKSYGIDSHAVMDIFCQDIKLNLSPYYLKPGFAFGGSCLPKDLRAITGSARRAGIPVAMLDSLLPSNQAQIEAGIKLILSLGKKNVAFLGFSFKAGTDDLRESPLVEVIERLLGKGYDLRIYDRSVNLAKLTGANRDYILTMIPHIERLMVDDMDTAIKDADIVVIGNNAPEFSTLAEKLTLRQQVVDFVRIPQLEKNHGAYHGLCW